VNGATALWQTLAAAGVGVCFANPGTTEMQLVAALDDVPAIRPVLGLFEGVCTGAADGYARVTGRPAATLLHLGPGLANGIANLHNARRARSPVVTVVGDHATWHLAADAPLTSDVEGLARPVSVWVGAAGAAPDLPVLGARAVAAACGSPGGPATLIVPQDASWDAAPGPAEAITPAAPRPPDDARVAAAADLLARGGVLLLGGAALHGEGLEAAAAVVAATGWRAVAEMFPARQSRGRGRPAFDRLPYFPEQAVAALEGPGVVLAGATEPVAFFGYPGRPSRLAPEGGDVVALAPPGTDVRAALAALAALARRGAPSPRPGAGSPPAGEPPAPEGPLGVTSLGAALAATLPDGAIVVDEGTTSSLGFAAMSAAAAPHECLYLTGGAIGQGLPCAVGAAIGAPGSRVLALQADGSGMYTLQALWTMARERLDVTVVVCANRAYRILQYEYGRATESAPSERVAPLMSLDDPALDWCALAQGHGVPAVRVTSADALAAELRAAAESPGPVLLEAVLA
jgi:acetolactate synthase-1/2/3 large subunit